MKPAGRIDRTAGVISRKWVIGVRSILVFLGCATLAIFVLGLIIPLYVHSFSYEVGADHAQIRTVRRIGGIRIGEGVSASAITSALSNTGANRIGLEEGGWLRVWQTGFRVPHTVLGIRDCLRSDNPLVLLRQMGNYWEVHSVPEERRAEEASEFMRLMKEGDNRRLRDYVVSVVGRQ